MQQPGALPDFNFLRKAACDFGWDWGPAFCASGIHGGVKLVGFSAPYLTGTVPLLISLRQDRRKYGGYLPSPRRGARCLGVQGVYVCVEVFLLRNKEKGPVSSKDWHSIQRTGKDAASLTQHLPYNSRVSHSKFGRCLVYRVNGLGFPVTSRRLPYVQELPYAVYLVKHPSRISRGENTSSHC
jgi:hypothetical protein